MRSFSVTSCLNAQENCGTGLRLISKTLRPFLISGLNCLIITLPLRSSPVFGLWQLSQEKSILQYLGQPSTASMKSSPRTYQCWRNILIHHPFVGRHSFQLNLLFSLSNQSQATRPHCSIGALGLLLPFANTPQHLRQTLLPGPSIQS